MPATLLIGGALVLGSLAVGYWVGKGSYTLPFLLAIGILTLGFLLRQPVLGLYLSLVIMIVVPYGLMRLPFPLLHSPLSIIVTLTLAVGLAKQAYLKEPLPASNLYIPLLVWAAILLVFVLVKHGPDAPTRAASALTGLWPLALVVLLVDTPRKARNVMLAAIVPLLFVAFLWLPALISKGGLSSSSFGYSSSDVRSMFSENAIRSNFGGIMAYIGGGSWETFSMMALTWPLLLSLAFFTEKKTRLLAGLAALLILAVVLLSSFGNALFIVATGTVFVVIFGARNLSPRSLALVLVVVILFVSIFSFTASGRNMWDRVFSGKDPSIEGRQEAWSQGAKAFLANPFIGWGAHNDEYQTASGNWLQGHNGFLVAAYEYGLVYLAVIFFLFFIVLTNVLRLGRFKLRRNDQAIVIGIKALVATYILQFFFSGSLGIVTLDLLFWVFIGLVIVWLTWLKQGEDARLVE